STHPGGAIPCSQHRASKCAAFASSRRLSTSINSRLAWARNQANGILHGGKRVRAGKNDLLQVANVLHHLFKSGVQFGYAHATIPLSLTQAEFSHVKAIEWLMG